MTAILMTLSVLEGHSHNCKLFQMRCFVSVASPTVSLHLQSFLYV